MIYYVTRASKTKLSNYVEHPRSSSTHRLAYYTCLKINAATFIDNNVEYNNRISTVIANLDLQEVLNYKATAKKNTLVYTTL